MRKFISLFVFLVTLFLIPSIHPAEISNLALKSVWTSEKIYSTTDEIKVNFEIENFGGSSFTLDTIAIDSQIYDSNNNRVAKIYSQGGFVRDKYELKVGKSVKVETYSNYMYEGDIRKSVSISKPGEYRVVIELMSIYAGPPGGGLTLLGQSRAEKNNVAYFTVITELEMTKLKMEEERLNQLAEQVNTLKNQTELYSDEIKTIKEQTDFLKTQTELLAEQIEMNKKSSSASLKLAVAAIVVSIVTVILSIRKK